MSIPNITANLTTKEFTIKGDGVYVKTNGNPGLLLIHAEWCGHCKRFLPTFQSLCKILNKRGNDFPCIAIESEELKKDGGVVSNALDVRGYPSLKFFDQYGKIISDYNGNRSEKDLLNMICQVYHRCIGYV